MVVILLTKDFLIGTIYNLQGESYTQASLYIVPMSLYVLLQLWIFAFGTFYKIKNNTKLILISSIIAAVLNLVLDILFVLGLFGMPKLGVTMAASSTVISMAVQLIIYVFFSWKDLKCRIKELGNYLENIKEHLKSSLPIMGEELIDGTVFGFLVILLITYVGDLELASYIVIDTILMFLFMYKYIYGSGALTLISTSWGKKDFNSLIAYPKMAGTISIFLYLVSAIIVLIFNTRIVGLITEDVEVQKLAIAFLVYFVLFSIISCIGYIYKCSLQALEEYKYVMYTTLAINVFTFFVMLALVFLFKWSLMGVALAKLIDETLTTAIFRDKYLRIINKAKRNRYKVLETI